MEMTLNKRNREKEKEEIKIDFEGEGLTSISLEAIKSGAIIILHQPKREEKEVLTIQPE